MSFSIKIVSLCRQNLQKQIQFFFSPPLPHSSENKLHVCLLCQSMVASVCFFLSSILFFMGKSESTLFFVFGWCCTFLFFFFFFHSKKQTTKSIRPYYGTGFIEKILHKYERYMCAKGRQEENYLVHEKQTNYIKTREDSLLLKGMKLQFRVIPFK